VAVPAVPPRGASNGGPVAGTSIDERTGLRQTSFEPHPFIPTLERRRELEREAYQLTGKIVEMRERRGVQTEGVEAFAEMSGYKDRDKQVRTKLRADTMSNDHLLKTVQDGRAILASEIKKAGA
jgi:hypothetical protein